MYSLKESIEMFHIWCGLIRVTGYCHVSGFLMFYTAYVNNFL